MDGAERGVERAEGSQLPRRRKRRDPNPRFLGDQAGQLDALSGCPQEQVPRDHLARRVLALCEHFDLQSLEQEYSSLGRRGHAPRRLLALWVYASLIGVHSANALERQLHTDAALRLLSGGHRVSAATLKRFRRKGAEAFAAALTRTVAMAEELGLLDTSELAVDSAKLRAHASLDAVRTVERSTRRLEELARVDVTSLSDEASKRHATQVKKHEDALALCAERGRTNVVLGAPNAGLMKFPQGLSAPGHRVHVVSSSATERIVVGALVDAETHDYGALGPALEQARDVLVEAGVSFDVLGATADAGYASDRDLRWAQDHEEHFDVLVSLRGAGGGRAGKKYFPPGAFVRDAEGRPTCPAGTPMEGPSRHTDGRVIWRGVGCDDCALRPQCTPGKSRTLSTTAAREAMAQKLDTPEGRARYRKRIATVEPVFASVSHVMRFTRASSRDPRTIQAEILLKLLAHNVGRLLRASPLSVVFVVLAPDGHGALSRDLRAALEAI